MSLISKNEASHCEGSGDVSYQLQFPFPTRPLWRAGAASLNRS